jgi:hypothetical protein
VATANRGKDSLLKFQTRRNLAGTLKAGKATEKEEREALDRGLESSVANQDL